MKKKISQKPRHVYDQRAVAQVDVDSAIRALNDAILEAHKLGVKVTLVAAKEDRYNSDDSPALIINARFESNSTAELRKA